MTSLSAFFAQNVERIENKKVIISDRFKDEKGNPIPWEIKAITSEENDDIQRRSMVNVPIPGRKGQYRRELDDVKYQALLTTTSVVFPDLNNAELQDTYGVKTPEALLKKMLYLNEELKLTQEVLAYSNFETLEEKVEEAKN